MSEHHPEGLHVNGSGLWMLPEAEQWDLTERGCRRLVDVLLAAAGEPEDAGETGKVPCEFYWVTDGAPEEVVGFLALRYPLNTWLFEEGGHIGYSVRPSRRREGHASRALGLAVQRAAALGIERALVTCDDDNLASARTIERNGGVVRGHPQRQAPLLDRDRTGDRPSRDLDQAQATSGRKKPRTRMNSRPSTMVESTVTGAMPRRRNSTFHFLLPGLPTTSMAV